MATMIPDACSSRARVGEERAFRMLRDTLPDDLTLFSSTSAAAAVVYGGNQQGPLARRAEDGGQTYRAWKEAKLEQAGGPQTRLMQISRPFGAPMQRFPRPADLPDGV